MMLVLLVASLCVGMTHGLDWDILPDDYVYACAGSKVTFPWNFKVSNNEEVVSVNWIQDGQMSSDMIATLVRDHFVPTAGYAGRVRHVNNGGLVLEDLTVEDSGNYTVEVNVAITEKRFESVEKSVHLQVADGLMLKGDLKAEQASDALWLEDSSQWSLRLSCGRFTFKGPPPVSPLWTTPSGKTLPSSGYESESGTFYLSLSVPVRGGNYTCTLPPARLQDLCYKISDLDRNLARFSASVTVDEMKARMSLLEANQKTLLEERADMQTRLETLENKHAGDFENVTKYCQDLGESLQDQLEEMQNAQQFLVNHVNKTKQKIQEAINTGACRVGSHQVLRDDWRSSSAGSSPLKCDKSLSPGWYRFYLNGENAVIPTECVPDNHCSTHAPIWMDLQDNDFPDVGEEAEGRACAHWSSDCCNWESDITVRNCGAFMVYKLEPRDNCHLAYCVEPQKTE